jgi:hypothetical protein
MHNWSVAIWDSTCLPGSSHAALGNLSPLLLAKVLRLVRARTFPAGNPRRAYVLRLMQHGNG